MSDSMPQIIHRAVTDSRFRAQLRTDLKTAVSACGLHLSDEEWIVLTELQSLLADQSATEPNKRQTRSAGPELTWAGSERSFTLAALA